MFVCGRGETCRCVNGGISAEQRERGRKNETHAVDELGDALVVAALLEVDAGAGGVREDVAAHLFCVLCVWVGSGERLSAERWR